MDQKCTIAIAVIFIVILVIFIPLLYRWIVLRKKRIDEVLQRSDEEKIKAINDALEPYGFMYDKANDVICTRMNPWQREVGYCKLYDEAAPALNMIIDSEPIYFEYDNRRWLIEFWKGQYGMTTGGEIGVYVTDKDDIDIPGVFSGPFFQAVSDKERLLMEFKLKRNENELFKRREYHWWLTGFDLGNFSNPSDLSMEAKIFFPNERMKYEFLKGLKNAGYDSNEFRDVNYMVYIHFQTPKSKQPNNHFKITIYFSQIMNKMYCNLYNFITKDFDRTIDKIDFLRSYYPYLFRIVAGNNRVKKLQKIYKKIYSYLNSNGMMDNEHM